MRSLLRKVAPAQAEFLEAGMRCVENACVRPRAFQKETEWGLYGCLDLQLDTVPKTAKASVDGNPEPRRGAELEHQSCVSRRTRAGNPDSIYLVASQKPGFLACLWNPRACQHRVSA